MNVDFSYKASKNQETEREIQQQTEKLARRLQVFRPDLVHLHGIVAESSQKGGGITVSLNLRLPSGQMASQNSAPSAVGAVKACFHDLIHQLNAHKDLLRNRHQWRRRSKEHRSVPFEDTVAAVPANGAQPSASTLESRDIDEYVSRELPRLIGFIDREVRYRVSTGALDANVVSREEVLDEAIAMALSGDEHRPSNISVERWLYGLALRAIPAVAQRNGEEGGSIHLETPTGQPNVTGSDDAYLQFHQPDDKLRAEDVLADPGISTPEAVALSDEFIDQLEEALAGASPIEREAFTLFTIEGFTVDEIAEVEKVEPAQVKKAIVAARERVDHKLPNNNALKEKLLRHSQVA
jgi:DNA-directed RNA polymerase specialized sigma24 family protein/ribosome-associated translation inhibitor RaiA